MGISRRGGSLPQTALMLPSGNRDVKKILQVQINLEGSLIPKPASDGKQASRETGERKLRHLYLPEPQIMCEEGFSSTEIEDETE